MDPNERKKNTIQLDELLREYFGEEFVEDINHSNLRLRVRTYAGDEIIVSLSRSTAKRVKRATMILLTAVLGTIGWTKAQDHLRPASPADHAAAENGACAEVKT
jgi:hypothetical protein